MTATINGIPLYEALIDGAGTGMFCISLVDAPAVESDFVAFDEQKRVPIYCVANEEKRIIRGVIMRSNFPIYRYCAEMGEYYITYSPETIRLMAEKYLAENRTNETTIHHIAGAYAEGVDMVQFFIKDTAKGVAPVGFESIEDGSLFAEFQVRDEYLWEQIKAGTFKGFSLEGVFALERVEDTSKHQNNMGKKQTFKERLAKLIGECFAEVTTDKGVLRWATDEDLRAGDEVFYIDENGVESKPEDGDYRTADGKVIRVEDGKVIEIVDDRAEVDEEGAEELPEGDDRIAKVEDAIARIEERVARIEEHIADNERGERLSAVTKEVAELREALSKVAPKGIAEKFEEQNENEPKGKESVIANLAKMREDSLK